MTDSTDKTRLDPARFRDIDLFSPVLKEDPVPIFAEWVGYEPFYAMISGVPSAVVTRHRDVAEAFSNHERLSSEKPRLRGWEKLDYFNGELNIAFSDPPVHTRLRETLVAPLMPQAVRELQPAMRSIAVDLLDRAAARSNILEIMEQLALPVARQSVLGTLLGLPERDFEIFIDMTNEMFGLGDLPPGAGHPPSYKAAWARARTYIDQVIDREQAAPSASVIGGLARSCQAGVISRGEMVAQLITLYGGGTSPIATLIGATFLTLTRHPDQLALLRSRPELVDAALDEVLRYHSPGLFNFRFAREDFVLNGLPVYQGMPVYIVLHAANFDPEIYEHPLRFDILRERKPLLTFGRGIHYCIGVHMAKLVAKTVLQAALDRFPRIELADRQPIQYAGNPQERAPVAVRLHCS